ncbi:MAG TPA: beta-propeller domain-containing protein [Micromonosporaceae bacterium]|nr:beta-propeller domain-containing protein [Micromonosporaceae bacterium]
MRNTTRGMAVSLALGITLTGCTDGSDETARFDGARWDTGTLRLANFDSCGQALSEFKASAKQYVGPYGFQFGDRGTEGQAEGEAADGRAAAPEAPGGLGAPKAGQTMPEHSTTNTHEAGVDEPDLVKTDGSRIVTVVGGVLRVVDAASRSQTGALALHPGQPNDGYLPDAAHLLLRGNHALVVLANPPHLDAMPPGQGLPPGRGLSPAAIGPELLLVDLSGKPRLVSRMTVDGEYVDARMVGDNVRVVVRSVPRLPFRQPDGTTQPANLQRENQAVLAESRIDDWLPRYEIDTAGRVSRGQVGCEAVSRPVAEKSGSGFAASGTSMLTVLSLDLAAATLSARDAISIVADGRTVYGTGDNLYIANDQRFVALAEAPAIRGRPAEPRTAIYKFDVSRPGAPRHTATGAVPGWIINQYAMSEYDGHLRVAATTMSQPGTAIRADQTWATESAVHVLAHQDRRLVPVGKVGGLGNGEQIYAVRFIGPVGYVVTFRQVDPLYVVDLRDPRRPVVTGELKITGYSAYLHPAGPDRLIGVGQEASRQGERLGTQVSLFDVSDPAAPGRLAQYHVRYGDSAAEYDPHAFLYWPKTGLLVIPVASRSAAPVDGESAPSPGGALVLTLSGDSFTELGTVAHQGDYRAMVQRSLYIDGTLWTVSQAGLQANEASTLRERAWIPFS